MQIFPGWAWRTLDEAGEAVTDRLQPKNRRARIPPRHRQHPEGWHRARGRLQRELRSQERGPDGEQPELRGAQELPPQWATWTHASPRSWEHWNFSSCSSWSSSGIPRVKIYRRGLQLWSIQKIQCECPPFTPDMLQGKSTRNPRMVWVIFLGFPSVQVPPSRFSSLKGRTVKQCKFGWPGRWGDATTIITGTIKEQWWAS